MIPDTKNRILDAAEALIAKHGYAGTSLRQVISDAGVNLAAVHYHFGSKEELLDAMVVRKIGPVNERRLALLEQYAAEEAPRPVPVERVLDAFLSPMGEVSKDHPQFVRAMGRIVSEGLLPQLIEKNFREIQVKLMSALRQALPELPPEEFAARVQFMFGVVAHVMCGPASAPGGFVAWIAPVIRFLVGGLSAPGPKQGER